jgi:type III pantothenate kinase
MILLLDVGNTRVKWAWLEYLEVAPAGAVAHDSTHRAWQREIEADGHRPTRVVVSNVAGPAFAAALTLWCRDHYSVDPEFVLAREALLGVRNGYRRPTALGVDRWLALIAAWRRSPRPTLIVSSGTALTIDALDGTGLHRGGLIIPGLAMLTETQAILATEPDFCSLDQPPLTEAVPLMLAAAAQRAWQQLRDLLGTEPGLLLTGGDASNLATQLQTPADIVPDLVLNGLAAVATNGIARA